MTLPTLPGHLYSSCAGIRRHLTAEPVIARPQQFGGSFRLRRGNLADLNTPPPNTAPASSSTAGSPGLLWRSAPWCGWTVTPWCWGKFARSRPRWGRFMALWGWHIVRVGGYRVEIHWPACRIFPSVAWRTYAASPAGAGERYRARSDRPNLACCAFYERRRTALPIS
jgi:hypothetical protein